MKNSTAGTGEPYWFEWSVGLLYVIKMLNPDNKIKNVVLQSHESQSLDDVVITYEDGMKDFIQVKHTREGDKISFSDMIEGEKNKSYLYKYSSEWKKMEEENKGKNRVIFFTNRKMGDRKYTPKDKCQRPPLTKFWKDIKSQINNLLDEDDSDNADVSKIDVKEDWTDAWKAWKEQMGALNEREQLLFLKNFDLITDQEDLDGIIDSIANELCETFATTHEMAVKLHQRLCYQLMWWSTCISDKKEIEKEDVMQALSLGEDEIVGEHTLPLCEPFFNSRVEFVKSLEKKILDGKSRVSFLTGNPGCGKTNIISYLASKPDSIVTLRFHAFKPIIPGDLYISADSGITEPKEFWGSLLIMLRKLFKGKLYEYHVPISIELIDSIDKLRAEVMRLSSSWADITGNPTVIAIDGIDHAARSGEKNTFLSTLLPPEAVPVNVRFIIAGQPVYQFTEYPDFLSDSERIELVEVPDVQKSDLELLYESTLDLMKYDELGKELVINYIANIAKGNTLSAVFAMQEATKYHDYTDFERNSNVKVLSSGIQSYYEYIWKSAIEQSKDIGYTIDMYLAAVFSIINRKISSEHISKIFDKGISVWQWEDILQNLFPIIEYDKYGYSVFHNDVRIYLASHLKKAKQLIPEISGSISDFLMGNTFDAKAKHELVFKLLKDAKREYEYVDVFTTEYVIEAYALKRNPEEIYQQMLSTLESLMRIEDKRKVVKFSCAVTTIYQHDESLRWIGMQYQYDINIPFTIETERKVVNDAILTVDDICNMFHDVELLVQQGHRTRAKSLFERWMGMRTPKTLFEFMEQKREKDIIDDVLKKWGKYARMFQIAPEIDGYESEGEKRSSAQFFRGWLKEAENYKELIQIEYTLNNLSCYYKEDLNDYFRFVIKTDRLENVQYILKENFRQIISEYNQLAICAWAIKNERINLCEDWIQDIKDKEFAFVPDEWFDFKYTEINKKKERFKIIADILYVLSYASEKNILELKESALEKSGFKANMRDKHVADNILVAINHIACIEKCIFSGNVNRLNLDNFEVLLNVVLEEKYNNYCLYIDTTLFRKKILKSIIKINDMLPQVFKEVLIKKLCAKVKTYSEISLFESYWRYLCAHNKVNLVEKYFDVWMEFDGKIWNEELSERQYISEVLLKIAREMRWQEKVQKSLELLETRSIGYVGSKEYSLVNPLNWLKRIMNNISTIWKKEGLLLMNISEYASIIGDNKAFVQIGGAIAESAAKTSANDLFQFINIVRESKLEWKELIFDGIISVLQTNNFTEEELLNIWRKAAEYFALNEYAELFDYKNTRNKIYCADTHHAISMCAERLGYNALEEKMKEIAPNEYAQERLDSSLHSCIIPGRWYESEYYANTDNFIGNAERMSMDEMFSYIEEEFKNGNFSWDYIKYFIQKAKYKDDKYILKYKPQIMQMLDKRELNLLEFDGCNRLYEVLFPYLNDEEVNNALKRVIANYYYDKEKGWTSTIYGLMTDLEHFTFALFSRFDLDDNIWALNEILKMHCLWISGTETLGIGKEYQFRENDKMITGWLDMFDKLEYI